MAIKIITYVCITHLDYTNSTYAVGKNSIINERKEKIIFDRLIMSLILLGFVLLLQFLADLQHVS